MRACGTIRQRRDVSRPSPFVSRPGGVTKRDETALIRCPGTASMATRHPLGRFRSTFALVAATGVAWTVAG